MSTKINRNSDRKLFFQKMSIFIFSIKLILTYQNKYYQNNFHMLILYYNIILYYKYFDNIWHGKW